MIIDTICAKPKDLAILVRKYRECHVDEQDMSIDSRVYLLMIPSVSEESYFEFLIDNDLAMSSTGFLRRFHSDDQFARQVLSRLAGLPADEQEEQ